MRYSLRHVSFATALCGAFLVSCAPASTTQRPESDKNIVTAADIEAFPNMPLEMLIQRKVSGVTAHNVNGALVLQIRGSSSIKTQEIRPPLYILDGVRTPGGSSGEMPSVSARDVATIKVLKSADAGLYGLDGANGVVVITTKGH